MAETWAFEPLYGPSTGNAVSGLAASVSVTAGITATATTQLPGGNFNGQRNLQIANTTNQWAYINLGVLGQLAAATVATGYPVGPGVTVVVTAGPDVNGASVILGAASTGGTTVIFTRGVGV